MNEWEWNLLEDKASVDQLEIAGVSVKVGSRVRLRPKQGGDILDIVLSGQSATIESIEEDYEGVCHVCVVLEDDPGRDLGMMRQPGHRFFFTPAELEPLLDLVASEEIKRNKPPAHEILVAGVGNIFLGDDGFGVEVVRRLMLKQLPAAVRVIDFGVRGLDLTYALQDRYKVTILIDAFPHGQKPGTVSVVEPDPKEFNGTHSQAQFVEPHSMDPLSVLRTATAMNRPLNRVLLIGCEPAFLGGEEGFMGLSEPVEAAVDEAVNATEALVKRLLDEQSA